jgi:hypothetical protein
VDSQTYSTVLLPVTVLYQLNEWEEPILQVNRIGSCDAPYVVPSTISTEPEADKLNPVVENETMVADAVITVIL